MHVMQTHILLTYNDIIKSNDEHIMCTCKHCVTTYISLFMLANKQIPVFENKVNYKTSEKPNSNKLFDRSRLF